MTSRVRHEPSDVDISPIAGFAVGLVASAVVVSVLVWALFQFLSGTAVRRGATAPRLGREQLEPVPPEPRLQTNPRGDLQSFRASEDRLLTTYGWIDRDAGVVRIPIDQAMALTVTRGLPSRPAGEGPR